MKYAEQSAEEILNRFMIACEIKTIQEAANLIGVAANSISGWKARNSIGILYEHLYPILMQKDISIYYVFFDIGAKKITRDILDGGFNIEARVKRLEEIIGLNLS
jgi:hypothetical protein